MLNGHAYVLMPGMLGVVETWRHGAPQGRSQGPAKTLMIRCLATMGRRLAESRRGDGAGNRCAARPQQDQMLRRHMLWPNRSLTAHRSWHGDPEDLRAEFCPPQVSGTNGPGLRHRLTVSVFELRLQANLRGFAELHDRVAMDCRGLDDALMAVNLRKSTRQALMAERMICSVGTVVAAWRSPPPACWITTAGHVPGHTLRHAFGPAGRLAA